MSDRYVEQVKEIVLRALAPYPASIYLFGSRARGDATPTSDVDVAVEPHGELPVALLSELDEMLEESTVPYFVDVVDLRSADPAFRERVKGEGVAWRP
jgi:predicted nucleotidyltransferase